MSTIEEVLKTIEAVESLLPSIKDTVFKEKQITLLTFGKELCQAYEANGMTDSATLEKLNRGSHAILEATLIQMRAEGTSQSN